MIRVHRIKLIVLVALTMGRIAAAEVPHLNDAGQLIVDGKPFVILGGELGNSTASHLETLKPHWSKFVALQMNTVLAPVYWDLIEPREGKFDFSLLDGLMAQAREHQLRLVLLWFGTWKNSMSCYAPGWVKADNQRFPCCRNKEGRGIEILSPFGDQNIQADATAFTALMQHLNEVDGDDHTVIMVQVENEIGMIPEARDHSPPANEKYQAPVPMARQTLAQRRSEPPGPAPAYFRGGLVDPTSAAVPL